MSALSRYTFGLGTHPWTQTSCRYLTLKCERAITPFSEAVILHTVSLTVDTTSYSRCTSWCQRCCYITDPESQDEK